MLIKNSASFPIGLDFSDSTVKMVQLGRKSDKARLQAVARADIPEGVVAEGQISDKDAFVKIIKKMLEKPGIGKFSSREAVVGLDDDLSFVKLVEIQKTSADIAAAVREEMFRHIPYAENEVVYDYQLIKDASLEPDIMTALVGAIPKNIIDQYVEILPQAGLSMVAAEPKGISSCRALLKEESGRPKDATDKNYGIIDIGSRHTSISLYSRNTILFSLSIPISGDEITKKIADSLKLDSAQAERAKIICGLDGSKAQGIIVQILAEVISDLNKRIKDSLAYYNAHFSGRGAISLMLLTGGGANIKDIGRLIESSSKIETKIGDVFANCEGVDEKEISSLAEKYDDQSQSASNSSDSVPGQSSSSSLSVAIGLALREIFANR